MINLEWFRTFRAIYECENVTEASKRLNMTQPGVSKHLSALEQHMDKKLFVRTTRKVIPTEYAKFLYTQIIDSISTLEKVEYYSGNRTQKERLAINIGCTSDFFRQTLRHRIYNLDMYIVTRFGVQEDLIEAVENESIHILVGTRKYNIYNHQFTFLKEQEFVLIASKNIIIPLDIANNFSKIQSWLQKQTWITYDNHLHELKEFWELNFNTSPRIIPRYVLPSFIDILEVLKEHQGFCLMPKVYCEQALKDDLIQLAFPSLKSLHQKLYYSNKLKNGNLKEINEFKTKMEY